MPTGIPITEELEKEVINYYKLQPISIHNLAKHFNLSSPTVIKILDKYHIDRYRKTKLYNPYLIEDFFSNIDTEAKAYYLGFIITDGNVFNGEGEKTISITQKTDDEYILQRFKDEIKASRNISHDNRGCAQFSIKSDIIGRDLAKYSVVENKTLQTKLPIIDNKYMPHLVRGIFDGDGSIKAYQTNVRNRYAHALSFCGTHQLMIDISNYLHNELNVKNNIVYDYQDRHLSEVRWQSKDEMYVIGEWMYKDASIYLIRKYETYLRFVNHYNLNHGNTEITNLI